MWKYEYYLQDGRGPFESVQAVLDELGLDKNTRPKHNRWSRLSAELKDTIRRQPKAASVSKSKFQRGDRVRFSKRVSRYMIADLRKRTRTIVDVFYDSESGCCFYEVGSRGRGRTLGCFRSYCLEHADGNQHRIGRPRQKRRYNYARNSLLSHQMTI